MSSILSLLGNKNILFASECIIDSINPSLILFSKLLVKLSFKELIVGLINFSVSSLRSLNETLNSFEI